MIDNNTIKAISLLEKTGQHGWAFTFDSHDVPTLMAYLKDSEYLFHSYLYDTLKAIVNDMFGKDVNYGITYGYQTLKIKVRGGDATQYHKIAQLFKGWADEILLYSYGYIWLERDSGFASGDYLELNWT